MALDGVNGVGQKGTTSKLDGTKVEEQVLNSIHGSGYKSAEKPSDEEIIKQKQHEARLASEERELKEKGITDPLEKAKYLMQKDIDSGKLKWIPEETAVFGLIKTGGYYEYNTEDEGLYGVETANDISQRYGLDSEQFKKDHKYISSDGRIYDKKIKVKPTGMPEPAE